VGRVDTPYATSEEQRERLLLAAKVARLSRRTRVDWSREGEVLDVLGVSF
jgi:hypothetical protein